MPTFAYIVGWVGLARCLCNQKNKGSNRIFVWVDAVLVEGHEPLLELVLGLKHLSFA